MCFVFFCAGAEFSFPLTKNNDIFVLLNKGRDQFVQNFHQLQFDKSVARGYATDSLCENFKVKNCGENNLETNKKESGEFCIIKMEPILTNLTSNPLEKRHNNLKRPNNAIANCNKISTFMIHSRSPSPVESVANVASNNLNTPKPNQVRKSQGNS